MELVNKFDNALSGVAGDSGEVGVLVNSANFLETGRYWDMRHCEPERPGAHDKNQFAAPEIAAGAAGRPVRRDRPGLRRPALRLPVYPPPDHCNRAA